MNCESTSHRFLSLVGGWYVTKKTPYLHPKVTQSQLIKPALIEPPLNLHKLHPKKQLIATSIMQVTNSPNLSCVAISQGGSAILHQLAAWWPIHHGLSFGSADYEHDFYDTSTICFVTLRRSNLPIFTHLQVNAKRHLCST